MAVYLDFNATTPVDAIVQEEICSVLKTTWGNPSSSYAIGKEAKSVIEKARLEVANMIGASSNEIIFTSGGTESNSMVIHSALEYHKHQLQLCKNDDMVKIPHIITTNIEHDSVRLPLEMLSEEGKVSVTFVPVSKETGAIKVEDIINEIRPNTQLISVMLANNETGVIQPLSLLSYELGCFCKNSKPRRDIFLHTDAAQAIGKIDIDVEELGVNFLTIVGHKFYGPRIGALYCNHSFLYPIFYGGGQERRYRPGTENTCMIAGLGKAAHLVCAKLETYQSHMLVVREYLEQSLKNAFEDKVVFNVQSEVERLPNTSSVAFDYNNISGRMLLDAASDVYASTAAACHSESKPSPILIASGVKENLASKTIRLSVGRETTKDDIDTAIKYLKNALFNILNKSNKE